MNFYNLLILSFTKKRAKFRDSIKILSIVSYVEQLAKINLFYMNIYIFLYINYIYFTRYFSNNFYIN